MNPIDARFQQLRDERKKAFIPFLTAGDPDLSFTSEALTIAAKSGASLIEVGFPFSDPVADGPVIQSSYTRALNKDLKLDDLFAALEKQKNTSPATAPLAAMASYSLICRRGVSQFIQEAIKSGFSGVVVPDLPVEESDEIAELCRELNFSLILLVSPTTRRERAEKIVRRCSGFVYVVSVVGITGERMTIPMRLRETLTSLRTMTDLPLCVGFGVSGPDQVRELRDIADGVIVGSALVRKLDSAGTVNGRATALREIAETITEMSRALNG